MKAKDKAKELVDVYYYELEELGITNSEILEQSKNCALICVKEILELIPFMVLLSSFG